MMLGLTITQWIWIGGIISLWFTTGVISTCAEQIRNAINNLEHTIRMKD